jgi:hypothetical protein
MSTLYLKDFRNLIDQRLEVQMDLQLLSPRTELTGLHYDVQEIAAILMLLR